MSSPTPFHFRVDAEPPGPVYVVTLAGRLDPLASQELRPAVAAAFDAGARRVVFDLSGLWYVGSLGLQVFLEAYNRAKDGGLVCLAAPTPQVREVFDLTKLTRLFRIYPTRADAVDAARTA